jgi:AhpD family alkylhydroperoxidase
MDERTKELVAIGASFAAHCQPCVTFHLNRARELGIGDDEIKEAISVGRMIQNGAMSAITRFVESISDSSENKSSTPLEEDVSSCCR